MSFLRDRRVASAAGPLVMTAIAWAYLASLPFFGDHTTTQRAGYVLLAASILVALLSVGSALSRRPRLAARSSALGGGLASGGALLAGAWLVALALVAVTVAAVVIPDRIAREGSASRP